jgi:hypothetical protein
MLVRDKSNSSATACTAAHTAVSFRQRTTTKSALEFRRTQELAITSAFRLASGDSSKLVMSSKHGHRQTFSVEPALLACSAEIAEEQEESIGPTIEAKENPSKNVRYKSARRTLSRKPSQALTHLRLVRKSQNDMFV